MPKEIEKCCLDAVYGAHHVKDLEQSRLYFSRTTSGSIDIPDSLTDAFKTLPALFEITFLSGGCLSQFQSVLSNVFTKHLLHEKSFDLTMPPNENMKPYKPNDFDDLFVAFNTFLKTVAETSEVLNAKTQFAIPPIDLTYDDRQILLSEKSMGLIEATVVQWNHQVRECY